MREKSVLSLTVLMVLTLLETTQEARADAAGAVDGIIAAAAQVTPEPRQLAWQELEFSAFVHFGMNTFTNREWGEGTEDPKRFNPTDFDARQWVAACKDAGMKLLILTAKHHDGFCLWPSVYTDHSVKHCPWKEGAGDVVRAVSDACKEGGIKFGIYLSPWDRHEKTYGDSPAYNEYYKNQLRELLTHYGEIAEVWMDGACGEGPNGKRQEYDWPGYFAVVRECQPNAVMAVCGPDVRWCGNEAGTCRESEWIVLPDPLGDAQQADLGSRDVLIKAVSQGAKLKWSPSEVNTSIRPGWFYHPAEDNQVKSLSHLLDIYYGSVGGNAEFLLNIPPDPRGRFHENDVARLKELGSVIAATFRQNLAAGATAKASNTRANDESHGAAKTIDTDKDTYWTPDDGVTSAELEFDLGARCAFNRVLLQEHLQSGQRIEEVFLDAWDGSQWKPLARATTVGYKRLLRFDEVTAQKVRVRITQSRVCPTLSNFGLFYEPQVLAAPVITRDTLGMVTIAAQPGVEVRYWIDDGRAPSSSSIKYEKPFPLSMGGIVKALPIAPDGSHFVIAGDSALSSMHGEPLTSEAEPAPQAKPEEPPKSAGWECMQQDPSPQAVKCIREDLPLSDQENKTGWKRYEALWDEFDGDRLDAGKWWPNNPTWKGRQPGYFWHDNVTVSGGQLHLAMRKQEVPEMSKADGFHTYTSAAVQSRERVRYGYFEVKTKAMRSAGSSSFWLYDGTKDWWTEIDVFEIGGKAPGFERKLNMTLHHMRTPVSDKHFQVGKVWLAPSDLADDYHVYGLEWDEHAIKIYFDGTLVCHGPNSDWHQPLTLNFDSETMPEWFGLPKDEDLPSTYSIEYVRVWKK